MVKLKSITRLQQNFKNDFKNKTVVITDINIFKGSHTGNIKKIHQQYPDIFFIVVTNNPATLSTEEALSYGIYGYLHKPISLAELELILLRIYEKDS